MAEAEPPSELTSGGAAAISVVDPAAAPHSGVCSLQPELQTPAEQAAGSDAAPQLAEANPCDLRRTGSGIGLGQAAHAARRARHGLEASGLPATHA
jgi:hypothetical protein